MTTKKTPVKKSTKKKSAVKKTPAKTTAAEKRAAIAIDTIKWLGTKAIKMKPGTYFQLPRKAIKYLPCGCCVFDPTVKKSSEHYEKGSRE